jgi:peptidoglycan/LPS O-acetylase OafA/YrhL
MAALYIALFHASSYAGYAAGLQDRLSGPARLLARMLNFGAYAVPIFIVLSGFCLMIPLARHNNPTFPGGVANYLRRRAWRILPSYYAALFLSLGLIALMPILQMPLGTAWDTKVPVTPGAIISHLLLLHNFNPDWLFKIDGPMWSIAIEWQIYFFFPFLLLPLLRRTNIAVTLIAAMALGFLPHFVLPTSINLDSTHPWFLGLFTMGMSGAVIAFSDNPRLVAYRTRVPWLPIGASCLIVTLAMMMLQNSWVDYHNYIFESLIGVAVMSWLIRYGVTIRNGGPRLLLQRLLEAPAIVKLGTFSYSIYLIHSPIQAIINLETLNLNMSTDARLALQLFVATPVAFVCAYFFYLLVERRSIQYRERSGAALAVASAPEPLTAD